MTYGAELTAVAEVMFQELNSLVDVQAGTSWWFSLIDRETGVAEIRSTNLKSLDLGRIYRVPLKDHPVLLKNYQSWRRRKKLIITKFNKKQHRQFARFLSRLPDYKDDPDILQVIKDPPSYYYQYEASFSGGVIGIGSLHEIEKEDLNILRRFAQSFELAQIRSLDLKKTEHHLRRVKIEEALENVRSRTMAMYQSDELAEIVQVLHREMETLQLKFDVIQIHEKKDPKTFNLWISTTQINYPARVNFPGFNHPLLNRFIKADERNEAYFSMTLDRRQKNSFYRRYFKTANVDTPLERQQALLGKKSLTIAASVHRYTDLAVVRFDQPTVDEEEANILMRFGQVFEQAYTRFLDLQKAEAQAREAQIEAGLERVRAASMAMHQSTDLHEVVLTVSREINKLELYHEATHLYRFDDDDSKDLRLWIAAPGGIYAKEFLWPYLDHPFFNEILEARKQKAKFLSLQNNKREKNRLFRQLIKKTDIDISQERAAFVLQASCAVASMALCENSGILLMRYSSNKFSEAENAILSRFAKVFEQSYVRFLDLQRVESQAREAQIEAGLERVRAASMVMHQSTDLSKTARVLVEQIRTLGIDSHSISIGIINQEHRTYEIWISPLGKLIDESYVMPYEEDPSFNEIYEAWSNGSTSLSHKLTGSDLVEHLQFLVDHGMPAHDFLAMSKVGKVEVHCVDHLFFKQGSLDATSPFQNLSSEHREILQRFAKVFEQAYTRFQDLQKAEEQAREAQIETALERIRASALAMYSSKDIIKVTHMLREQMTFIGETDIDSIVIHIYDEEKETIEAWYIHSQSDGKKTKPVHGKGFVKWNKTERTRKDKEAYYSEATDYTIVADRAMLKEWYEFLEKNNSGTFEYDSNGKMIIPEQLYYNYSKFSAGAILLITKEKASDHSKMVLKRTTEVFNLAYTRFLDLQKAEAQAREAQVEAALERVRAASMAMHKSSELPDVALSLVRQLTELKIPHLGISILIIDPSNDTYRQYSAHDDLKKGEKILNLVEDLDGRATHLGRKILRLLKKGDKEFTIPLRGKHLREFMEYTKNKVHRERGAAMLKAGFKCIHFHFAVFHNLSNIVITTISPITKAHREIFGRMAATFGMSFRRYLDLQRAETQAREAQIEAALERVRAEAMAMHESRDLGKVVKIVFEELVRLNLEILRCGIGLINGVQETVRVWITSNTAQADAALQISGDEPLAGHPLLEAILDHWKSQKPLSYVLEGTDLVKYYRVVAGTKFQAPVASEALEKPQEKHHYYCVMFPAGGLFGFKNSPFDGETLHVLHRFTDAFHLAYTRFEDLQKAESRAREAIREASLDRVRAQIASMRTSTDLERITPLIWQELTVLGVPFFRCGIFIIDDEDQQVQVFLTSPTGDSQTSLLLPFGSSAILSRNIDHWRQRKIFTDIWTRQQFINWTKSLVADGYLKNVEDYRMGIEVPGQIALHFLPFSQGMLYVGCEQPLDSEALEVAQSLAKAFSVAYARYEDFIKLDEAKTRVESTLQELQAAQVQLIHSEKMASLGELTAGIAHEIQNPLNFVNNFAEVSNELITEAKEELERGDILGVHDLLTALIQNLDKINHHGQRASSIVKGMLDHSRTSSGEKVLANINQLCDEYLRLAYHGMRAKDKSFNINYETTFEDDLPQINIIPQDIGRVVLNLVNNAFQACQMRVETEAEFNSKSMLMSEKPAKEFKSKEYQGVVKISTQVIDDHLEIHISDNGPGIASKNRDKIFQPFFTTKPAGQGTGLGLSLSYDIVKAHGGEISVVSQQGKGTSFHVLLPLS